MNATTVWRTVLTLLLLIVAGCTLPPKPGADTTRTQPPHHPESARPDVAEAQSGSALPHSEAVASPPAPPASPVPVSTRAEAARKAAAEYAYAARQSQALVRVPAGGLRAWQRAPMSLPPLSVNTENYTHRDSNPVVLAAEQPVSTFSIDVDTGSYTNVRRMLNRGQLPPADAVRAEEFINYFDYGYAPPVDPKQPFSVTTELAPAPWNAQRQLLLVGIQGYRVPSTTIPVSNLVFLVDTSGSMNQEDKLPLLKSSLKQLVRQLRKQDRVAIVTYAGSAGVALPSTAGDQHATINAAIDQLNASGSTNGGAGIAMAYEQAAQGFVKDGVNRVILATDGDFNVGTVSQEALKSMVEDKRRSGIALTTLGFGGGNYNDAMAVMLADAGNGSHHYIDTLQEGRRVLVDEMSATLLTIAKDVKIQVEFNPALVQEYRLIGYEKRMLKREDFNNDKVDAGEIGAGANVTAIYEITPKGSSAARIDPLRYGATTPATKAGSELAFLRLRYKLPGQDKSRLIEQPVLAQAQPQASERLRYAAAVAAFADVLRGGNYLEGYSYEKIADLAHGARGDDADGYRAGFVQLVKLASGLSTPEPAHVDRDIQPVAGTR